MPTNKHHTADRVGVKHPPVQYDTIPDPTVEVDEITDEDMLLINTIKIQNKIREVAKSVSDDGFDPKQVTPSTLNKIGILASRLKDNAEEIGLGELAENCVKVHNSLSRLLDNIDDIQSDEPLDKMTANDFILDTWGVTNDVQNLWVFSLKDVASEL
jgi:hypothetical protein